MSKKEILIVEDEETVMKLECLLLSSRGYSVKGVSDGEAALDSIESKRPDLVLLDIMLPAIDGYEVCRQIKSRLATRDIPVIMVTARRSREDLLRGEEVGADWYITKPFKSSMLIETVNRLLAGDTDAALCPQ